MSVEQGGPGGSGDQVGADVEPKLSDDEIRVRDDNRRYAEIQRGLERQLIENEESAKRWAESDRDYWEKRDSMPRTPTEIVDVTASPET